MARDHFSDFVGARAIGMQDHRCAKMQREIHAVAEAVGEIELGNREQAVMGTNAEDAVREIVRRDEHVLMTMDRRFRSSAAAGGVKEECSVGGRCGMRLYFFGVRGRERGQPVVPDEDASGNALRLFRSGRLIADHQHVERLGGGTGGEFAQDWRVYYREARAGIFEVVAVIRRARHWVHWHSDGTDLRCAEKSRYEFEGVRQRDEYAFARLAP